ncbi:MAG: UDP-N-acetylmuramoylalanyl-D-glutamyl-2,6-diaminopimelate--D-alanyl-D-alanine ligase [Ancalomicrobiaceae bacterium]|nr:UDP-N-acetylmuramoylalanyl-D-glutamyl-2,6-diaminopimelate--D-alanyl-D-alanine ligase [Ancalomicrobiaceae bacterium]
MTPQSLWMLEPFLAATGGRVLGAAAAEITGISIDSRTVAAGEAFFAIKGDTHDGHSFVHAALERGAGLAVVAEERLVDLPADGRYVVVDDVLQALGRLGAAARARSRARVVAVTGSVGKTSTKEALKVVLAKQGSVHASPGSFNNHWGVPLTLARLPADIDFAIFEIGMNHAGEITPLAKLVRPHVAIVTTVAPVHLEYFDSVADIARAKGEIFAGVEPGGAAVINGDIAEAGLLETEARRAGVEHIYFFGERPGLASHVESLVPRADGSVIRGFILGAPVIWKVGAPGRHVAINSLAVLTAATLLGADLALAALALAQLVAPQGRGSQHTLAIGHGSFTLIDESYNANPASMRAAIDLLGQSPVGLRGRRIAVLGDMLELGEAGPRLHAELAERLSRARVDRVYCAGSLMRSLWHAIPIEVRGAHAETAAELKPVILQALAPGDVVMVKGSNGSRMGQLVEAIKKKFPSIEESVEDVDV